MNSIAAVSTRHDLGNGVIVVHPTPGHGGEGIARDVLGARGKRFRDRTLRDPRRLQALAGAWLRAEVARELVIAGADRRPAVDWRGEYDAARVLRAVERARRLTMLWFELRRGFEPRHGPGPRHALALLDTLVAPCCHRRRGDHQLRGAQASFLLSGTLLAIDPDAFADDHQGRAGAPATSGTAALLRSYVEPHLAAAGTLASATRANAEQIAELTLGSVARAEHAAADRLIAARLLEDDHGVLRPTPVAEATFRARPEPRYLNWTA
jgi:hypothetical protein